MLVCGFRVKICLDLVVSEMYRFTSWLEEIEYSWVNLIVRWIEFM